MKLNTPENFMHYLECKIDLFPSFVKAKEKYPADICNRVLFKEEFTYENWLNEKIGKRLYKTGFPTITTKGAKIYGELTPIKDTTVIQEGYEYSIYRFVKYNFKRTIYINQ